MSKRLIVGKISASSVLVWIVRENVGIMLAIAEMEGVYWLTLLFIVVWIVQFTFWRIFPLRNKSNVVILDRKIEDWLVLILFPLATALLLVPGIFAVGLLVAYPFFFLQA